MNDTKKMNSSNNPLPLKLTIQKNQILVIQFHFKREIHHKINDTKKLNSNYPLQFYIRKPIKK